MKRAFVLFFLLLAIVPVALSQGNRAIVTSFALDEYNMSANVEGQKVYDQDGELCALIIVRTAAKGLLFEGGMVGVMAQNYRSGEYWVYIPRGMKRIKIKGEDLEVSIYDFPISIESARTYIMTLTVPSKKKEYDTDHSGIVSFRTVPSTCTVILDNHPFDIKDGYFNQKCFYGDHDVEIIAQRYRPKQFSITVNSGMIDRGTINLTPAFGYITITGIAKDATAYLDGKKIALPNVEVLELDSGEHNLVVKRPLYLDFSRSFSVTDAERKTIKVSMVANYKEVTISAPLDADIYLDGKRIGASEVTAKMEYGTHRIEARKERYSSSVMFMDFKKESNAYIALSAPTPEFAEIMIDNLEDRDVVSVDSYVVKYNSCLRLDPGDYLIRVDRPSYTPYIYQASVKRGDVISIHPTHEPIYGSLSVVTSKPGASLFLDGLPVGLSPAYLSNIIIGDHRLEIKKEGCNDISTSITINENEVLRVEKELTSIFTVTFIDPEGSLFVDGRLINKKKATDSNVAVELPAGKHKVKIVSADENYRDRKSTINVTRNMIFDKKPLWNPPIRYWSTGWSSPGVTLDFGWEKKSLVFEYNHSFSGEPWEDDSITINTMLAVGYPFKFLDHGIIIIPQICFERHLVGVWLDEFGAEGRIRTIKLRARTMLFKPRGQFFVSVSPYFTLSESSVYDPEDILHIYGGDDISYLSGCYGLPHKWGVAITIGKLFTE